MTKMTLWTYVNGMPPNTPASRSLLFVAKRSEVVHGILVVFQ